MVLSLFIKRIGPGSEVTMFIPHDLCILVTGPRGTQDQAGLLRTSDNHWSQFLWVAIVEMRQTQALHLEGRKFQTLREAQIMCAEKGKEPRPPGPGGEKQ